MTQTLKHASVIMKTRKNIWDVILKVAIAALSALAGALGAKATGL